MYIEKDKRELPKAYPFDIGYFIAKREDNTPESYHWHSFLEITYVEEGKGCFYVNGKTYEMEAGDVIIFNQTEPHGWRARDEKMVLLVLVFSPQFIADKTNLFDEDYLIPFKERGSYFKNKVAKKEQHTPSIATLLKNIYEENQKKALGFRLMIKVEILHILTILIRHYEVEGEARELLSKQGKEMRRLEEAFHYIKDNYTRKITLEAVAQIACMSPSYFSSYFKKVTGQSFKEYVIAMRLKRAEELLSTTTMSSLEVANSCGFSNMANFYHLYKKYKGHTPKET